MQTTDLNAEYVQTSHGRDWFRLRTAFAAKAEAEAGGLRFTAIHVTVPAEFVTDFLSIPRWVRAVFRAVPILRRVFRHTETDNRAAVVHDWLYQQRGVPRVLADAAFLAVYLGSDDSRFKALTYYLFVRLFGRRAWRKRQRRTTC